MAKKVIVQQTKNKQYIVTLPKQIAELKGFKKGATAYWTEDKDGNLVLVKGKEVKKK